MIDAKNIIIVLPAFNESTVILSVIENIRELGYNNILVVNDGSSDSTSILLNNNNISELRLPLNRGVGAAIRAGILYVRRLDFEYLVLIDADGQHYPEDIELLVKKMSASKADIIIGSRFKDKKSDIPFRRIIYNKIANIITLTGRTKVTDSQSGFRMLNRTAIEKLNLKIDDYGVCTEMIWKSRSEGLTISEVAIRVRYTEYSLSKGQNLVKGIKTGFNLIKKI